MHELTVLPSMPANPGLREVRALKSLAREQTYQTFINSSIELLKTPAVSLVAAFTLVEVLQKIKVLPDAAGTVVESALVTKELLSSLGGAPGIAGLIGALK